MISLLFYMAENRSFFTHFLSLLFDGGPFFMFPIVIMLLLVLFLGVKGGLAFKKGNPITRYRTLINSIGLLTLVWGVLGQLIGLVEAFDRIELVGDAISIPLLAGGLKLSALSTIFGFFVFIISRIISVLFTWIEKDELQK